MLQYWKAASPIKVTPLPISTVVKAEQPEKKRVFATSYYSIFCA